MKTRLATSLIALSTAFATPSFADVTAADVWSNQQALWGAMGISLNGDLSGDQLTNPEINIILPQGVASMQIKTDAVSMVENGDGSVTVSYPSPMTIAIAGGAEGEGSFTAEIIMTHEGYDVVATGNPGDITYDANATNIRMEIGDVTTENMGTEEMTFEGFFTLSSWIGTSHVTEGNLITYAASSETGTSVAEFTFTVDNVVSESKQTSEPLTSVINAALPVGGSDVMNLSAALRDGLNVVIESTTGGSASNAVTALNGEVMNRQDTTTGPQTATLAIGNDGLRVEAEAADISAVIYEPLVFPANLEFSMDNVSAAYDIPLNASEDTQDFRVATTLDGIVLGDTIWNLIDPSGQLPRDPADISFDVTGMGTSGIDLLDIAAMSQLMGPPPIEVDEVTIENLRIAAVGAEATAQGAMTFDWSDFQTIPGIARPEGQVTVNLNGANQLMDTLVAMGLIPEEELMMPRMMMGMFATPVGDDQLESVLEINDQGHILANGQRLQ